MPKYFLKILKYKSGEKSPFAIYLDFECLLKKKRISLKQLSQKIVHREKSKV